MRRLNILASVAAFLYLLSLSLCNAQDLGNNTHTEKLNRGLIAYVNEDYSAALRILEPLAEKSDPLAQLMVGRLFANGQGTPQNCERAVEWLARAAQGGNAEAAFHLASFSENGHCMPHSIPQALAWYQIAAANGDVRAPSAIGEIYLGREYAAPDPQKAIFWFERGMMLFDATSYYHLGEMYAKGEGVPKDLIEAYKWFDLAAGMELPDYIDGAKIAAVTRDKIREQLMPAQMAEGQKWASEFRDQFFHPADHPTLHEVSAAIFRP